MSHIHRLRRGLLAVAMLAALLSMGSIAFGAPQARAATCSGYGCDGRDPDATGCSSGAYTANSVNVYDFNHGNQYLGTIELRYSPACGTNWSRVTSAVGVTYLQAIVQRMSDHVYYNDQGNYLVVWSDMVYAPTVRACATGTIRTISAGPACA